MSQTCPGDMFGTVVWHFQGPWGHVLEIFGDPPERHQKTCFRHFNQNPKIHPSPTFHTLQLFYKPFKYRLGLKGSSPKYRLNSRIDWLKKTRKALWLVNRKIVHGKQIAARKLLRWFPSSQSKSSRAYNQPIRKRFQAIFWRRSLILLQWLFHNSMVGNVHQKVKWRTVSLCWIYKQDVR